MGAQQRLRAENCQDLRVDRYATRSLTLLPVTTEDEPSDPPVVVGRCQIISSGESASIATLKLANAVSCAVVIVPFWS